MNIISLLKHENFIELEQPRKPIKNENLEIFLLSQRLISQGNIEKGYHISNTNQFFVNTNFEIRSNSHLILWQDVDKLKKNDISLVIRYYNSDRRFKMLGLSKTIDLNQAEFFNVTAHNEYMAKLNSLNFFLDKINNTIQDRSFELVFSNEQIMFMQYPYIATLDVYLNLYLSNTGILHDFYTIIRSGETGKIKNLLEILSLGIQHELKTFAIKYRDVMILEWINKNIELIKQNQNLNAYSPALNHTITSKISKDES
jgi:hypothetical protein